jgi:hypothetical protein
MGLVLGLDDMGVLEFLEFLVKLLYFSRGHLVIFLPVHHEPADELADAGGEEADTEDQ